MTNNILSINNFDLYYEIHGEGLPLLMLHGFTGSGNAIIEGFKELTSSYQLIVPDLRGHGRSTNPSKEFTFKQAAKDIFALLKFLNIQSCYAVGFSGGGCTLLQMAHQQSEIFKSMILVSAAPYFPRETRAIMQKFSICERTDDEWLAMRKIHMHGDEQIHLLWSQAQYLSDMDFTPEKLMQVKTKTLLVQGDRDPFYSIDLTIEMFKNMSEAYLWIVPNAGHVPITTNLPEFI